MTKLLFINMLLVIKQTSSFNIDDRDSVRTTFNIEPRSETERSQDFAGYNFVVTKKENRIKLTSGAPKYRTAGGNPDGAVFVCSAEVRDETSTQTSGFESSDWLSDITCKNALNGSSLELGNSQRRGRDFFGTTLLSDTSSDQHYVICAPGRRKSCGNTGTYLPGACYSGALNNTIRRLEGWGEIRCFNSYLDILFLIDSSNSISAKDFNITKEILINTTKVFADSLAETTQIGILQYGQLDAASLDYLSNNPRYYVNPIKLGDCNSVQCFQTIIENSMNHLVSADTYTAHAIRRAVEVDFQASKNRLVSKKFLVLITDGGAIDGQFLQSSYDITRDNNVTVYAIGVGNETNREQLKTSANGGTSDERVLTTENYDALSRELLHLTRVISQTSVEGLEDSENTLELAQLGLSGHIAAKRGHLYLGVVGSDQWSGNLIKYDALNSSTSNVLNFSAISTILQNNSDNSYLGYAITSGYYEGGDDLYVAASAPKFEFTGAVIIYESQDHESLSGARKILPPCDSSSCSSFDRGISYYLGSYFGAALLSVDVNGDGKDDLLISAPLYTGDSYDEGRVFVYVSTTVSSVGVWTNHSFVPLMLTGDGSSGGRFGTALTAAGDLNGDSYTDVIIGAPYADENRGVIYVYHGERNGIMNQIKQKISASSFGGPPIYSFGHSLHVGIDVDDNSYPDLFVGAPQSNVVVLLRARPIARLEASLRFNPSEVGVLECFNQPIRNCFNLTACFNLSGESVESSVDLIFNITLDGDVGRIGFGAGSVDAQDSVVRGSISLLKTAERCRTYRVYVKRNIEDLSSSMIAIIRYELSPDHLNKTLSSLFSPDLPRQAIAAANFIQDCGTDDECKHGLQISASIQLPEITARKENGDVIKLSDGDRTLVVAAKTVNHPIRVAVNLSNSGEVAYGSILIVTYPSELTWKKISNITSSTPGGSNCVVDNNKESIEGVVKTNTLSYMYNQEVGNIFPPGAWCTFVIEILTGELGIRSNPSQLNMRFQARAENSGSENKKSFKIPVNYQSHVRVTRSRQEILIGLNSSQSSQEIHSVAQISDNDIVLQFQVRAFGFSQIPRSTIGLRYPAFWGGVLPLLYLYKVDCLSVKGNPLCTCDKSRINHFNLAIDERDSASSITIASSDRVLSEKFLDCSNLSSTTSYCDQLHCDVTKLDLNDEISFAATFKVWPSTFHFDKNNTETVLRSGFFFNSSFVIGPFGESPILHHTSVDVIVEEKSPIVTSSGEPSIQLYIIGVGAGVGAIVIVAFIFWKCNFFKRQNYVLQHDPSRYVTVEGHNEIFENVQDDPLTT